MLGWVPVRSSTERRVATSGSLRDQHVVRGRSDRFVERLPGPPQGPEVGSGAAADQDGSGLKGSGAHRRGATVSPLLTVIPP
jgi:hypothetical protein